MSSNESPNLLLIIALQGKMISRMIADLADIGVADLLVDGPKSVTELADKTSTNEDALYRVLRALCAIGVFKESGERQFENNEASKLLISDMPGTLRDLLRWLNCKPFWNACREFDYSLKTGQSAFNKANGKLVFEYLKDHEDVAGLFNNAMSSASSVTGPIVADTYDFSGFKTIVDIGGGHGSLLAAIITKYPHLRGVVFDLPEVIQSVNPDKLTNKLDFQAGDFFEGVPKGADIYIMKHIIHDWDDEHCVKLLRHCCHAMSDGGKVLVVEQVITDAPESVFAKLFDIEMLAITHSGRERTVAEFKELFTKAGLKLTRVVPTKQTSICIVEAVK